MTMEAAVYPDLEGGSVCVTGAARGLGLAMAEAFVRAGCHVLLLDIDGAELDRVLPVLAARRRDRVIRTATAPVSDEDAVTEALTGFTARTGELSVMVANAGVSANAPSLGLGLDRWNTALDVNLTGVFVCARAAARVMREGDGGVILTTSSMYGVTAGPERAAYCATKGRRRRSHQGARRRMGPARHPGQCARARICRDRPAGRAVGRRAAGHGGAAPPHPARPARQPAGHRAPRPVPVLSGVLEHHGPGDGQRRGLDGGRLRGDAGLTGAD
ncbi:SDR family NAD(P)-dependent oxidoreductase [Streptomyces sp. TE33382]